MSPKDRTTHLLFALKDARGGFVSGETLSKAQGISRTAIWKQVAALRRLGYEIEATPRRGYRLAGAPDLLLPQEIAYGLNTRILGKEIRHLDSVTSTNGVVKSLAEAGAEEGTIVVAEVQTGGKGRLGRGWFSPRGGVWLSVLLRPAIEPIDGPKLTMVAGLGCLAALAQTGVPAAMEWPNDLMIRGRKVGGILLEVTTEPGLIEYAVVGIGINLNVDEAVFPADLRGKATSVKAELGRPVDRPAFARNLLEELERWYLALKEDRTDEMVSAWRDALGTIGKRVEVATLHERFTGDAIDIDARGSLVIRLSPRETRTLQAGDVTIIR